MRSNEAFTEAQYHETFVARNNRKAQDNTKQNRQETVELLKDTRTSRITFMIREEPVEVITGSRLTTIGQLCVIARIFNE